jgi:ParB/RepB/Spo0J family partition protein
MNKGAKALEQRNISELIPYENNARTHSDEQVRQIAESIKEFGFANPIQIDEQNNVIAGHGRLQAANLLGLTQVPVIIVEGLSDTQRKALIIADNKIALNAGWNNDLLRIELNELTELDFNVDLLGFSEIELQVMNEPNFEPVGLDEQGKLDEKKKHECPNCGEKF